MRALPAEWARACAAHAWRAGNARRPRPDGSRPDRLSCICNAARKPRSAGGALPTHPPQVRSWHWLIFASAAHRQVSHNTGFLIQTPLVPGPREGGQRAFLRMRLCSIMSRPNIPARTAGSGPLLHAHAHAKGLNETGLPYRALSVGTGLALFCPTRTAPAAHSTTLAALTLLHRTATGAAGLLSRKQLTTSLVSGVQEARTLIRLTRTQAACMPRCCTAHPQCAACLQKKRGFIQRPALQPAGPAWRLSACAGSRGPRAPAARRPAAPQQRPQSDRPAWLCSWPTAVAAASRCSSERRPGSTTAAPPAHGSPLHMCCCRRCPIPALLQALACTGTAADRLRDCTHPPHFKQKCPHHKCTATMRCWNARRARGAAAAPWPSKCDASCNTPHS